MFRKKAGNVPVKEVSEVDELGNVKARLAASESLNKSLVERVAALEKASRSHGSKIEENDDLWKGYSEDMNYLRGERDEFKRENDKAQGKSKARKMNSGEIRKQLAVERRRRELAAKEKSRL